MEIDKQIEAKQKELAELKKAKKESKEAERIKRIKKNEMLNETLLKEKALAREVLSVIYAYNKLGKKVKEGEILEGHGLANDILAMVVPLASKETKAQYGVSEIIEEEVEVLEGEKDE